MKKLTREEHILRAVRLGKAGQFGLTGIKVELEAKLNRHRHEVFQDVDECNLWFNRRFAEMGLADEDDYVDEGLHPLKKPLVYANFYNDGSVDSELTLTISLEKDENIFLVPKMIELWNEFAEEVGEGMDIRNAGMHMTLLRNPRCYYSRDYRPSEREMQCFNNFSRAMSPLMPALFLLGSSDSHSRPCHFRQPVVSTNKYSAIHYVGGALEFRVFETCYDHPQAALDNFVVMRNCLRFWREEYMSPKLERCGSRFTFGNDNDETVARFFTTATHLDLLNAGLVKIKPAYYTVREIKKNRGVNVTKASLKMIDGKLEQDARIAYKEYEDRFTWSMEVLHQRTLYYELNESIPEGEEEREQARLRAAERAANERQLREAQKVSLERYIQDFVQQKKSENAGNFTLSIS